jgi:methionyl-tRNA formyltransferase
MRLLYLGSPAIAVPFLETCAREHEVAAVVTQPDRPAGRGMELTPPAVKTAALALGLKVLQPEKPSAIAAELAALKADMAVVVAYGRMLKPDVLAATRHGFMNVHFSLLPKYRGAAPMAWALINGETRTGVSLFWIDQGMDTGPVQRMAEAAISPEDDALSLGKALTELGTRELSAALADVAAGKVLREPQAGEPSLAPKLGPELAHLSFAMEARRVHDRVRGLRAGPKAFLSLEGNGKPFRLVLLKTELAPSTAPRPAGEILRLEDDGGVLVQFSSGPLRLLDVQPEGKKPLRAADFLRGLRLKPGDRLKEAAPPGSAAGR